MLNDFAPISNSLSTTDSTFVFSQQHDKELAAGTSRVGWIFWCVDESGKLKIESVSQSVEKLGLQSVKPGMPVEQLGTCVRENDRTAFTEHFAACLVMLIDYVFVHSLLLICMCDSPQLPKFGFILHNRSR